MNGFDIEDLEVAPPQPPPQPDRTPVSTTLQNVQSQTPINYGSPVHHEQQQIRILQRQAPVESSQQNTQYVTSKASIQSPVAQPFSDPAILSYKKPVQASTQEPMVKVPQPHAFPGAPPNASNMGANRSAPLHTPSMDSSVTATPQGRSRKDSTATATLTEPFNELDLHKEVDTEEKLEADDPSVPIGRRSAAPLERPPPGKYTGKRSKRGVRNKGLKEEAEQAVAAAASSPVMAKTTNVRSKGWRQDALVQEFAATTRKMKDAGNGYTVTTTPSKKLRGRSHKKSYSEDPSGWATEEATDIQEMGEFDFQANLNKFDKRSEFAKIRNDDTTADEDRLVFSNRRPRPGTMGGKNLHPTENVLDSPTIKTGVWNSEAGETEEEEAEEDHYSSGRASKRALSRASTRGLQSRKGSGMGSSVMHSTASTLGGLRTHHSSSRAGESPRLGSRINQRSSVSTNPSAAGKPSFRLVPSNKLCPCINPLQMLEIEQLAVSEFGLTEDMISENAGRSVAEAAVAHALDLASTIGSPMVIVLVGNHKSGARTVAAARHLLNRGARVTMCVLGYERGHELLESLRRQVDIFSKAGGRVARWEDLSPTFLAPNFDPDLIIDALFGVHIQFEDLRTDDQATAFDIITWANMSKSRILAVDVPSGLSASTGTDTPSLTPRLYI